MPGLYALEWRETGYSERQRADLSANGKYYQRDIVALPERVPVDLRELLVYQLLYIFHSELIDEAAHDQAAYSCWVIMHRYSSPRS